MYTVFLQKVMIIANDCSSLYNDFKCHMYWYGRQGRCIHNRIKMYQEVSTLILLKLGSTYSMYTCSASAVHSNTYEEKRVSIAAGFWVLNTVPHAEAATIVIFILINVPRMNFWYN